MITRNTDYSIQRMRGLSTDTKPTDVPNGSEFREMDTGKKFLYSAAAMEWIEQPCCGGGSVEPLLVTIVADNETEELSVTFKEISDALGVGKNVYVRYTTITDNVRRTTLEPVAALIVDNQYFSVSFQTAGIFRATSQTGKLVRMQEED